MLKSFVMSSIVSGCPLDETPFQVAAFLGDDTPLADGCIVKI